VSDLSDLTPTAGARYVLERVDGGVYTAQVHTPDAIYEYAAVLAPGAEPVLEARGTPAPAALEDMLRMIARLTARGHDKRVADGLPPWPQRITRWRGPGRGG
jgi:hypothetical protein